MFMSLIDGADATLRDLAALAAWTPTGSGEAHPLGAARVVEALTGGLCFAVTARPAEGASVLRCDPVEMPAGGAILRVDEVCFPVGAVAHRHTHTGGGIRYLTRGALRLEADDHVLQVAEGGSWFEAAASPVRAVALQGAGVSSFLRAMVLPPEDEGRSTFTLCDPGEADLPRLQVTHRHVDHPFQVDAG